MASQADLQGHHDKQNTNSMKVLFPVGASLTCLVFFQTT